MRDLIVVVWNRLWSIIRRIPLRKLVVLLCSPALPPKLPAVFNLHPDVLLIIYDQLSPVDRACLSLSCKRYYALFGSTATTHEAFKFPRLLHIKEPQLCMNRAKVTRNRLLIRLEDSRWAFCGMCLMLHPRREFRGCSLAQPPLQRSCESHAGIADLCPCISLTIREREQLVKLLRSSPRFGDEFKGLLTVDFDESGSPNLRHTCLIDTSVRNQLVVKTQIDVAIFIDMKFDRLRVRTNYICNYLANRMIEIWTDPIFKCPHWDLFNFISYRRDSHKCEYCGALTYWCPGLSDGREPITICVWRSLGRCNWPPDAAWLRQCRFMAGNSIYYKHFWDSSLQF